MLVATPTPGNPETVYRTQDGCRSATWSIRYDVVRIMCFDVAEPTQSMHVDFGPAFDDRPNVLQARERFPELEGLWRAVAVERVAVSKELRGKARLNPCAVGRGIV